MNETVKNPAISSENSQTVIYSSEVHSQDNDISNRIVNPPISEQQKDLKTASPDKLYSSLNDQNVQNCQRNLFNVTLNQTELKNTEEKSE